MLSYKHYTEARKNPELNPKVSAKYALLKYIKDDKDVYVSFRNINKLGIHPASEHIKTPIGIYCYRLESYKKQFLRKDDIDLGLQAIFPYMGSDLESATRDKSLGADRNIVDDSGNYIYVFKVVSNKGYGVIRLGNMTKDHVIDFIEDSFNRFNYTRTHFIENEHLYSIKRIESAIGTIKRHIRMQMIEPELYKSIIKDAVEDQDKGKKILFLLDELDEMAPIHKNVDVLKSLINELTIYKRGLQNDKMPNYSDNREFAEWVYNKLKLEKGSDTNGGIFWKFLKNIFPRGHESSWGVYMYKMGVVGVDDNKGDAIIHPNEPYQTVFFNKNDLQVVEVLINKEY